MHAIHVVNLQAQVSYLQAHLASLELLQPQTRPPPLPQPQPLFLTPPPPSITDLPASVSPLPSTYDLASTFDQAALPLSWATQQRRSGDPRHQYGGSSSTSSTTRGFDCGNSDLEALAHELY
ncbi:unnamed protein product [Eruca vesicaria subsp. sativa]|uniref:LOB domain-containing protein n=1 Tax=Eruca vesicaria subsp. sativa TaxID=29727 RepID=A0ABC8LTU1_ERUVS|nr:unnamed protein product [Eruca vesicaria subsp. sativa]